jgi:glycosyltransferase involved in cell wall biosynthesis
MREKVSIALATYNGAKYLKEQLDSIARQSRMPDELVIHDDCSSDDTVAIASDFAKRVTFQVTIARNEYNLGYTGNFSYALQSCSGDYVFLCDQDDVWHSEKIARVLAAFHARPSTQLLIHDLDFCKQDLTRIGQTKLERMDNIFFDVIHDYVTGMATAIRGPFLKLCLPVPNGSTPSHDWWLHHCAANLGCKVIMKDVLALYRRHETNATKNGSLNVDFVTTPEHFIKERATASRSVLAKDCIGPNQISEFTKWLIANHELLAEQNIASIVTINQLIAEDVGKVDCALKRLNILSLRRSQRFNAIFKLFRIGGYNYFAGWKSAVKDLLIN